MGKGKGKHKNTQRGQNAQVSTFVPSSQSEGARVSLTSSTGLEGSSVGRDKSIWWNVYYVSALISTPFALALSYKRNRSVGWAIVHSLVSVPYLVYRAIDQD